MPLLAADALLSMDKIRGRWIHCERGLLWLTVDGDDVILKSGESHHVDTSQRVVIQALTIARFAVLEKPIVQPRVRPVELLKSHHHPWSASNRLHASLS